MELFSLTARTSRLNLPQVYSSADHYCPVFKNYFYSERLLKETFMKNKIKEVMTTDVHTISPECNICEAARQMKTLNVGTLPICDGDALLGMITDRDIALRVVASSYDPSTTTVKEVMSSPLVFCFEDDDIDDVARIMETRKVRRLAVLNHDRLLVGIISLSDVAMKSGHDYLAGEILEKFREPETRHNMT